MMDTAFTPWSALAGGMLIGLAAVMLMASTGRIAGTSGIVSRLLGPKPDGSSRGEGLAFVVGLLSAVPLWTLVAGDDPTLQLVAGPALLVVSGLLVGFGSVLGNGCTSGHGVCGLSRLSTRSMVATATFMTTAVVSVYVLRHVVGG